MFCLHFYYSSEWCDNQWCITHMCSHHHHHLALQPYVSLGLLCYSPPLVSILSFPHMFSSVSKSCVTLLESFSLLIYKNTYLKSVPLQIPCFLKFSFIKSRCGCLTFRECSNNIPSHSAMLLSRNRNSNY
jgi:hypothetical protein